MKYIGNIGPKIDIQLYHLKLNNKKLTEEILSVNKKINNSPLSTFFEDSEFNILPGTESELFFNQVNNFFKNIGGYISRIWSHIHEPLESTNTHNHGIKGDDPLDLSWVYYVKVPTNSGQFVIDMGFSDGPRIPIFPVEGNLMIFPSWLPHMVTKNLSNTQRISISGNVERIKL